MKRSILLFLTIYTCLSFFSVGFTGEFNPALEKVTWREQVIIPPIQGEIKTNTPVFASDVFYFTYKKECPEKTEWVIFSEEKELFRAADKDITFFRDRVNPQYVKYWKAAENGTQLVVRDTDGNLVPLPHGIADAAIITEPRRSANILRPEEKGPLFQYWLPLENEKGYRNGLSGVITLQGEELFPRDYYKFMHDFTRFGNYWNGIWHRNENIYLFHKDKKKLEAKQLSLLKELNLWQVENDTEAYLLSIDTQWTSAKYKKLRKLRGNWFIGETELENPTSQSRNHNQLLYFENNQFKDMTPPNIFATFMVPIYSAGNPDEIAPPYLIIEHTNSLGAHIYNYLGNEQWAEPHQASFRIPQGDIVNFFGNWRPKENLFSFVSAVIDHNKPNSSTDLRWAYNPETKKILYPASSFSQDSTSTYRLGTRIDIKKNRDVLNWLVVLDLQGNQIFEKRTVEDGFTGYQLRKNEPDSPDYVEGGIKRSKVFYKEHGSWSVYDLNKKENFPMPGVLEASTTYNSDFIFLHYTNGNHRLYLPNDERVIELPKISGNIEFLGGSSEKQSVLFKIKENNTESIIKLYWN